MFSPLTVFLDLETTGLSPSIDGITEVGAVVLRAGEAPYEWSTLVRPVKPIPPEIARMTGITNEMVRDAPVFADIAPELLRMLDGALLVAHNARFDYAFLKQAFARAGFAFFAPTLCTARLARELDPGIESAGLDALIERYRLRSADRHRALGDTRLALALARHLAAAHDADVLAAALKRVMKRPSLPKHLPVDTLLAIPERPGVYLFYGLNRHPLYIGKAAFLKERVGAHFSGDWTSERGTRLSEELRHIEWIETAGELSALLLEAELVRQRMPAHNIKLRRREEATAVRLDDRQMRLEYLAASTLTAGRLAGIHGPFGSRRAARATLIALAGQEGLCLKVLGLEKRARKEMAGLPCFAYQVRRCRGACCGEEAPAEHWSRLTAALAVQALPLWPYDGSIELIERDPLTGRSARFEVLDWCLLGEDGAVRPFDHEAYRILRPYIEGRKRNSHVTLTRRLGAPHCPAVST